MDEILTKERRNALGSLLTNWLSEQDEDGRMLDTFDYFDVDKIDELIDEAIAPAIADAVQCAKAALSAPAEATQAVAAVPEGWKLMPIDPTVPMLIEIADLGNTPSRRYDAMLAAAPQAPVADAARADDRVPRFIPIVAHDCALWQGGAKLGVAASTKIAEETAVAINAWNRARAQQPACVWGASTLADLDAALDGAHELSGAPHERITELIRQRDEARAAAAPAPQPVAHPDDAAVDAFAVAMKEKLAQARAKGRGGWEQCDPTELSIMLREHVEKGDPRDVANFCMFLWHHDKPIGDAVLPWGKRATAQQAVALTDAARDVRNSTIERCAQLVDQIAKGKFDRGTDTALARSIAARIRALAALKSHPEGDQE